MKSEIYVKDASELVGEIAPVIAIRTVIYNDENHKDFKDILLSEFVDKVKTTRLCIVTIHPEGCGKSITGADEQFITIAPVESLEDITNEYGAYNFHNKVTIVEPVLV